MHRLNTSFAGYIRDHGGKRKIISRNTLEDLNSEKEAKSPSEISTDEEDEAGEMAEIDQIFVTSVEMMEWVKEVTPLHVSSFR
jgi:hypothetical protein